MSNQSEPKGTVLVVDDDRAINNLVAEVLRDEGFDVHCCFTQAEALAAVKRIQPQVMVIDLQLETRDAGIQLLRALRDDPVTEGIGVILCSADSLALHQQRHQVAQYRAVVVPKPFQLEQLVVAIMGLL